MFVGMHQRFEINVLKEKGIYHSRLPTFSLTCTGIMANSFTPWAGFKVLLSILN